MSRSRSRRPLWSGRRGRWVAACLALATVVAACGDDDVTDDAEPAVEDIEETLDEFAEETADAECLLDDATVAEITGSDVERSGFAGGGSSGDTWDVSYEGCSYYLVDGGDLLVALMVDADGRTAEDDFAAAREVVGRDDGATAVPAVGTDAFAIGATVYAQVGDRYLYVRSDTDEPKEADREIAVALAAAVVDGG